MVAANSPKGSPVSRLLPVALIALSLAGCGRSEPKPNGLDQLDRELTDHAGNERDPAVASALRDQIMVDPALTQQSNANAIRPAPRPDPHQVPPEGMGARPDGVDPATLKRAPAARVDCPECRAAKGALTLGALAERQRSPRAADCAARVRYSAIWSVRLPAGLPLYPDARVAEAAGTDAAGCRLRIVSFASSAPPSRVIDWYYGRVTAAGYSGEHKTDGAMEVLGGTHGDDAYLLYVTKRAGGSDVDLVVNAAR